MHAARNTHRNVCTGHAGLCRESVQCLRRRFALFLAVVHGALREVSSRRISNDTLAGTSSCIPADNPEGKLHVEVGLGDDFRRSCTARLGRVGTIVAVSFENGPMITINSERGLVHIDSWQDAIDSPNKPVRLAG